MVQPLLHSNANILVLQASLNGARLVTLQDNTTLTFRNCTPFHNYPITKVRYLRYAYYIFLLQTL